jgi:hypothetical protein
MDEGSSSTKKDLKQSPQAFSGTCHVELQHYDDEEHCDPAIKKA